VPAAAGMVFGMNGDWLTPGPWCNAVGCRSRFSDRREAWWDTDPGGAAPNRRLVLRLLWLSTGRSMRKSEREEDCVRLIGTVPLAALRKAEALSLLTNVDPRPLCTAYISILYGFMIDSKGMSPGTIIAAISSTGNRQRASASTNSRQPMPIST
jgi:hypothetical protein